MAYTKMPKFYKLLKTDWIHHGYRYNLGINVLHDAFVKNSPNSGGFFFCTREQLPIWLSLYENLTTVCDVILPVSANVTEFDTKWKSDIIFLDNPRSIYSFLISEYSTDEIVKIALNVNPRILAFVPSSEIYSQVLTKDPSLIQSIPPGNRSETICWQAVRANPYLLQYVPAEKQTLELCTVAVKASRNVIPMISKQYLRTFFQKQNDSWWDTPQNDNPWWRQRQERLNLGLEWS